MQYKFSECESMLIPMKNMKMFHVKFNEVDRRLLTINAPKKFLCLHYTLPFNKFNCILKNIKLLIINLSL